MSKICLDAGQGPFEGTRSVKAQIGGRIIVTMCAGKILVCHGLDMISCNSGVSLGT